MQKCFSMFIRYEKGSFFLISIGFWWQQLTFEECKIKDILAKPSTVINLCLIVKCHLGQTVVLYAIDMF